jgi:hypothetical protein
LTDGCGLAAPHQPSCHGRPHARATRQERAGIVHLCRMVRKAVMKLRDRAHLLSLLHDHPCTVNFCGTSGNLRPIIFHLHLRFGTLICAPHNLHQTENHAFATTFVLPVCRCFCSAGGALAADRVGFSFVGRPSSLPVLLSSPRRATPDGFAFRGFSIRARRFEIRRAHTRLGAPRPMAVIARAWPACVMAALIAYHERSSRDE